MHSVAEPINVRCYSNRDIIVRRSEVTLRARSGLARRSENGELLLRRATIKRLSRLCGEGDAEKYAEQNGSENGERQTTVFCRAIEPRKLLVQQLLIAPSHRG